MVRCASLFRQLIALFDRKEFYRLVIKHQAERYVKGYSSCVQLVGPFYSDAFLSISPS